MPVKRPKPLCGCGCGETVARHGRRFVKHHGNRFQHGPQPHRRSTDGRWVVRPRSGSAILWYRIVMWNELGRELLPAEVVHHINGDPEDDRPENLQVFSSHSDHMRHEFKSGRLHGLQNKRAA